MQLADILRTHNERLLASVRHNGFEELKHQFYSSIIACAVAVPLTTSAVEMRRDGDLGSCAGVAAVEEQLAKEKAAQARADEEEAALN